MTGSTGAPGLAPIDIAIVLAFTVWAVGSGWRARRLASTGPEEYFLAGRSLSGTRAGISMAATQFAADTPLLVTGLVATAGVFALWRLWIYAVAFLLLGFVLAPAWRAECARLAGEAAAPLSDIDRWQLDAASAALLDDAAPALWAALRDAGGSDVR